MKENIIYSHLTWPEIKALDKENLVVLQPFAAIEDHGHHLPVDTDCMLINALTLAAARKVGKNVLVMPLIPYGYVEHHMDFPGPISIDGHHLIGYLSGALKSLARHGFKRILVTNGHGSNRAFMDVAARMVMDETQAVIGCVTPYSLAKREIKEICECPYISHAEELETSLVLFLDESLVVKGKEVREIGFPISKYHWRSLLDAPPLSFTDRWSRISESGVVGDATLASKEKGEKLFKAVVDRLAELIEEFGVREIRPYVDHH